MRGTAAPLAWQLSPQGSALPWSEGDIAVHNKSDFDSYRPMDGAIAVLAKAGEGLEAVVAAIGERLAWVGESASPVVASERRRAGWTRTLTRA